jgi:hypothetical protein
LTLEIVKVVSDEVNVRDLVYVGKNNEFDVVSTDEQLKDPGNQDILMGEARDIVRKIQEERKALETNLDERINVFLEKWPKEHEGYIKRNALVNTLSKGAFQVKRLK